MGDATNVNEAVKTTKREQIDALLSKTIHGQMITLHVMTQTLRKGNDPTCLMDWVLNMHTEVTTGSKWVAVVVKNLMAILITFAKGIKVIISIELNYSHALYLLDM